MRALGPAFMGKLQRKAGDEAIAIVRKKIRSPDSRVGRNFGIAAKAFWPKKTAVELAVRARINPRTAENYIAGRIEPNLDAWFVLIEELRR